MSLFSFLLWCPTVFTTDARDEVHKIITSARLKTGIHTALAASTSVSEVVDIGDYKDIVAIWKRPRAARNGQEIFFYGLSSVSGQAYQVFLLASSPVFFYLHCLLPCLFVSPQFWSSTLSASNHFRASVYSFLHLPLSISPQQHPWDKQHNIMHFATFNNIKNACLKS